MAEPDPADGGVRNDGVREAVEAFAAEPGPERSIEVLRQILGGPLLLDVTGSDIRYTDDGSEIAEGSTIQVASMRAPDGTSALVAFTSQAEIERVHGPGEAVQSLVQPGVGVLELVVQQDHRWLYLDPAGPTCGLARDEVEFALQTPRNDAVLAAVAAVTADRDRRGELLDALRAEGVLLVAVDPEGLPDDGELSEDTPARIRTTELPDGRPALLVFTSGPEVLARGLNDAIVAWTTDEVRRRLGDAELHGMVVNAAGPWVAVTADELLV